MLPRQDLQCLQTLGNSRLRYELASLFLGLMDTWFWFWRHLGYDSQVTQKFSLLFAPFLFLLNEIKECAG